jgi:hypothetical protein
MIPDLSRILAAVRFDVCVFVVPARCLVSRPPALAHRQAHGPAARASLLASPGAVARAAVARAPRGEGAGGAHRRRAKPLGERWASNGPTQHRWDQLLLRVEDRAGSRLTQEKRSEAGSLPPARSAMSTRLPRRRAGARCATRSAGPLRSQCLCRHEGSRRRPAPFVPSACSTRGTPRKVAAEQLIAAQAREGHRETAPSSAPIPAISFCATPTS